MASLLALAALLLLPALGAARWMPGRDLLLVSLLLIAAAGLVVRALAASGGSRVAAWLVAAGALASLAALGLDGVRGRQGRLRLVVGQAVSNFEETTGGGRSLGLRPLGFTVALEGLAGDSARLQLSGRGALAIERGRSLRHGPYRLGLQAVGATGEAVRLRIAATSGSGRQLAELTPDEPARLGDLVVSLERYFADFALDEKQQPYSASNEPRNPAALLQVRRGAETYRGFALQAMPGVHRIEPLGLAFSLLEVEPERAVSAGVHHRPFAWLVALGGLALAVGALLAASRPRPADTAPGPLSGPLLAGATLTAALLLADGGGVLAWSFGLPGASGRHALAGVGVLFGVSLLTALAGTLLLAAQAAAPSVEARPAATVALWLAAAAGALGLGLAVSEALRAGLSAAAGLPLVGLGLALALVALSLRAWRLPVVGDFDAEGLWPVSAPAALLLALGLGWIAVDSAGTYATPRVATAAACALLALATQEPTLLRSLRRFAFLLSLLLLLGATG